MSSCKLIPTLASKAVSVRNANIATTQRYIDVNDDMKRQAVDLV